MGKQTDFFYELNKFILLHMFSEQGVGSSKLFTPTSKIKTFSNILEVFFIKGEIRGTKIGGKWIC